MISTDTCALGLLTDLYQLTMAAGYWKNGIDRRETVFHLFFRKNPFAGGYAVACGLQQAIELLQRYRFTAEDVAYLAEQHGNDGAPLFESGFLDTLRDEALACDVDAVPEGTVVFPFEPLLRIRGPLVQCQVLETALLTILNFQTLIATKAARVCQAAAGDRVLEFGLRRAQGLDGGLSASRAAYVGGCAGTSNVLAGKVHGIPIGGTHAHSWVMSFPSEEEAFEAYATALPNNCIFLVDTYDTIEGVKTAIRAGHRLRKRGHEMAGIRLDSGDLLGLSIEARRLLDEAGFPNASVVASNDLEERSIAELKANGARIDVWGVGTKLATAYDQPALGGVYKLGAFRDMSEGDPCAREGDVESAWRPVLKLSEERIKISNPGFQQVRRFSNDDGFVADVIYDKGQGLSEPCSFFDLEGDETAVPANATSEDVLVPVFRGGRPVYEPPPLAAVQARAAEQLALLGDGVRRFDAPERYPVGLDRGLHRLKERLVAELESNKT